ncbi:CoA transferase [Roseomonas gilardii]|uniref:CoA transferase n=1 Tax=Roseomonas gilardii TaxID=257708 RepID=UPI001C93187A|nr:CoA transferase [Roseomonas gilardii]
MDRSLSSSNEPGADLPLAGVRVLDLSRILAGPCCAMVLGDLGAEVVKVEHPIRGDDTRDWGLRTGPTNTSYFRVGEAGLMALPNGEAGQAPLKFGVAAVDLFTGQYAA